MFQIPKKKLMQKYPAKTHGTVVSRFSGLRPSPLKCQLNCDSPLNGIFPIYVVDLDTKLNKYRIRNRLRAKQILVSKLFVTALICMLKLIGKFFKARLFFVGKAYVMVAIPTP